MKPVLRRVWAPAGERPTASGHHRFERRHVTVFVAPATGEAFWYLSNGVSKPFFETLPALFARDAGAGRERTIVLGLDNAGWHGEPSLKVPEDLRLVYLPPYTPELQPAETLWTLVDEPIANQHVATYAELEHIIAKRCVGLAGDPERIKSQAKFHWRPKTTQPN